MTDRPQGNDERFGERIYSLPAPRSPAGTPAVSMRAQGHVVVQTGDKTRLCTHSVGHNALGEDGDTHTHEREARYEGPVT